MSRRRARRDIEQSSLSFLDCICCGFGAVILLLVLTKFAEPILLEQTTEELEAIVKTLEEQLEEIRGETKIVNADLESRVVQLSEINKRVARLQGDLSSIEGQFNASDQNAQVSSIVAGQLAEARQRLTEEMRRLRRDQDQIRVQNNLVGGIPVEWQDHIVSMRKAALEVGAATDLESARAAAERISESCQGCHTAAGVRGAG